MNTQMQRTYNITRSFTADERTIKYASYFFYFLLTWWRLPVKPEWQWRAVDTGVECFCSPSLNSPRSNLQTAAEFWQILPWCLLPLGDTFFLFIFLSSSLVFTLAPQAIVSSVLHPCLRNQMDLQGLLSTSPFLVGLWMWCSLLFPLFTVLPHHLTLYDDLVMLFTGGVLLWHCLSIKRISHRWPHNMSWPVYNKVQSELNI